MRNSRAGRGKKKKKTDRGDRNVQKSVSKMCCDAPLIKQPNSIQTTLASCAWHSLVPPQGRCSRCCCPTSSSALWRYLGQGNDAALRDGQREASTIGLHTQQNQSKAVCFVGLADVSPAGRAASGGCVLVMCINVQCARTNTQHVSALG